MKLKKFTCFSLVVLLAVILFACNFPISNNADPGILAFPTAEGFGAGAVGGRGGTVLHVTNMNDSGPGSFREACEATGPRIVVFDISGTIFTNKPIFINDPYITIAGQTAPSPGITVASILQVVAPEVIIRHLRVAPGDPDRYPSLNTYEKRNALSGIEPWGSEGPVIIDHCSVRWTPDDSTCSGPGMLITWQNCLISEGLNTGLDSAAGSIHSKGYLNYNPAGASFHHNIIAKMSDRNPYSHGGNLDFVNNLVYDWSDHPLIVPLIARVRTNFVGNYYKRGTDTERHDQNWEGGPKPPLWVWGSDKHQRWEAESLLYLEGNICPLFRPDNGLPEEDFILTHAVYGGLPISKTRINDFNSLAVPQVTTTDAFTAKDYVLTQAGATVPERDVVDQRIVNEIITGTGKQISEVADVGGYPKLVVNQRPEGYDTDRDGMPDAWETAHELNPQNPGDGSAITSNGYTNVELFLNELAGDNVLAPVLTIDELHKSLDYGMKNNLITDNRFLKSLKVKVDIILKHREDATKVANGLKTLQNEMKSQSGKKIEADFASLLQGYINNLIDIYRAGGPTIPTPSPTVTPDPTPTPVPLPTLASGEFIIGNASVLDIREGGNSKYLNSYAVTLGQTATIQSLSLYIEVADGNLRLGIYDDDSGKPGILRAWTDEFTPESVGWVIQNVTAPVQLTAGTYWLAFSPRSNNLEERLSTTGGRSYHASSYTYDILPVNFPKGDNSSANTCQFSLFAIFAP